jgi:hypothetical protein
MARVCFQPDLECSLRCVAGRIARQRARPHAPLLVSEQGLVARSVPSSSQSDVTVVVSVWEMRTAKRELVPHRNHAHDARRQFRDVGDFSDRILKQTLDKGCAR